MGSDMKADGEEASGTGELVRSLFLLLVLAGVGIGVLLSMEMRGRERRAGLAADKHDLETRLAFVEARRGEMLSFLARPETELVKLAGVREWNGQSATVAWDPSRRMAVVLVDRLPAPPEGERYELWAVPAAGGEGKAIGEVEPGAPSQKVFAVPAAVGERVDFEIMLEGQGGKEGRAVFASARA